MDKIEDTIEISGLDLKIDDSVQAICENYNKSSGSTRSVLYVLLLVNILSLLAVINTIPGNWSGIRLSRIQDSLISNQKKLKKEKETYSKFKKCVSKIDTVALVNTIDSIKVERDNLLKSKVNDYQTLKVPFLGITIDVNDLGLTSGISFILLLGVVRFMLNREKNNLRLALKAITLRYPDDLNDKLIERFPNLYAEHCSIQDGKIIDFDGTLIKAINKSRRKYHYNYMSMNEVFNLPNLEISKNKLQRRPLSIFVTKHLFYIPYFVFLCVFFNDIATSVRGFHLSPARTIALYIISFYSLAGIAYIGKKCNLEKIDINDLFESFYGNYIFSPDVPLSDKTVMKGNKFVKIISLGIPYSLIPIKDSIKTFKEIRGSKENS